MQPCSYYCLLLLLRLVVFQKLLIRPMITVSSRGKPENSDPIEHMEHDLPAQGAEGIFVCRAHALRITHYVIALVQLPSVTLAEAQSGFYVSEGGWVISSLQFCLFCYGAAVLRLRLAVAIRHLQTFVSRDSRHAFVFCREVRQPRLSHNKAKQNAVTAVANLEYHWRQTLQTRCSCHAFVFRRNHVTVNETKQNLLGNAPNLLGMRSAMNAWAGILPVGSLSTTNAESFVPDARAASTTVKPRQAQPVLAIRMLFSPATLLVRVAGLSILTMVWSILQMLNGV